MIYLLFILLCFLTYINYQVSLLDASNLEVIKTATKDAFIIWA